MLISFMYIFICLIGLMLYTYILYKKLPKWLQNICITKICIFNNFEKYIAHY